MWCCNVKVVSEQIVSFAILGIADATVREIEVVTHVIVETHRGIHSLKRLLAREGIVLPSMVVT